MLLRELVTRFGFEVDKKNVKEYDSVISGAMSKGKKLAAIFGGAFTVKQVLGLGLTVKQTSEDLRRLAGTDFSQFISGIQSVKGDLEGIRKGAGNILPDNTANALGSFFIKNVGKSQQDIKDFTQLLKVASIAAVNTRRTVADVFTGLVGNRNNGGADTLLGLGGFDKKKQGKLEFIMETRASTNAPGGNLDRSIRGNLIRNELNGILPAMVQNLKSFDNELFTVKITKNTVTDFSQKMSSEATDRGVEFLKSFTDIPNKGLKGALFDIEPQKPVFKGGGKVRRDTNELFFKNKSLNRVPVQNNPSQNINKTENNVTNQNTFNITSDDPRKIGAIVEQKMDDIARDASLHMFPNEDR